MYLDLSPSEKAFRDEVRAYLATILDPEFHETIGVTPGEGSSATYRKVIRRMGADGWLGVGWPPEYGGQGRSPIEQYIFFDECRRARARWPFVTLNTVGPTLMDYGTPEQKQRFLPPILAGETLFGIGYTEPDAGTDLAGLRTRAVRDGGDYIINGQKVFTTHAHEADYIWLAARTDPDAPKHRGISIFIVDTTLSGFKAAPISTIDGGRTNASFYEDVRVPGDMIVGGENEGWRIITHQLNHERVALGLSGRLEGLLDDVVTWARSTKTRTGARVIDEPWAQLVLARVRAQVEALRLVNWHMAWDMTQGMLNPADASAVKVFSSELFVECSKQLLEVVGQSGLIREGSPGAVLAGRLEHDWRWGLVLTFGGGVNEVQREIIATLGLGMPRGNR
jgi:alkylation response protein AidB-like acyl-CoA dehydrogenase